MKKKTNTGYLEIPTFAEIRQTVEAIDCDYEDVTQLFNEGIINQAEYEQLLTIIHGKGDTFRTVPYDNFSYYRQQGPLTEVQTETGYNVSASTKSRLKKIAYEDDNEQSQANYTVTVGENNITMYTLELEDPNGGYTSIFNIDCISPAQINSQLTNKFDGINDGTTVYFMSRQNAQDAADWLKQQINGQG